MRYVAIIGVEISPTIIRIFKKQFGDDVRVIFFDNTEELNQIKKSSPDILLETHHLYEMKSNPHDYIDLEHIKYLKSCWNNPRTIKIENKPLPSYINKNIRNNLPVKIRKD